MNVLVKLNATYVPPTPAIPCSSHSMLPGTGHYFIKNTGINSTQGPTVFLFGRLDIASEKVAHSPEHEKGDSGPGCNSALGAH